MSADGSDKNILEQSFPNSILRLLISEPTFQFLLQTFVYKLFIFEFRCAGGGERGVGGG